MSPDAVDLGLELLPAEDDPVTADEELGTAEESALDDVPPDAGGPDAPLPIGMTWEFDFATGHFARRGGTPVPVHGVDGIRQWCLMTIHSARYAHAVFSDEFGMEEPEDPIGETWNSELLADYRDRLTEALLIHDRISAVADFEAFFDPLEGVLEIDSFDVVLDDDSLVAVGPVAVPIEGEM
jgi:hypothetical protein